MAIDVVTLALAKKFTQDTISGTGAIKGAPCTISKTDVDASGNSVVTFSWEKADGTKQTTDLTVSKGVDAKQISTITIDTTDNHVKVTMSDGTIIDAGEMPVEKVNVSKESGNALTQKSDGLYVSTTGVEVSAKAGNIITTETDGLYAKADEINISKKANNIIVEETDGLFVPQTDISGKVDKVTGKSLVLDTDITQITTNKNAIDTLNGASTVAGSVDKKIADAIGGITEIDYQVVASLPTTGVKGTIYLVANGGTIPNIYDEYIWVTDKFEKIGTTEVDLSQYFKKEDIQTAFGATTSNTKVPSEKLVKDNLDNKAGKSEVKAIYDGGYAGKNIWDEEYLVGYHKGTDGTYTNIATQITTKNIISVKPSSTIYLKGATDSVIFVWYDQDKNALGEFRAVSNGKVEVPSNAYYAHINFGQAYGITYNNDIIVSYDDILYQPYIKSNVELTDTKVDKEQGVENKNKILAVGSDGKLKLFSSDTLDSQVASLDTLTFSQGTFDAKGHDSNPASTTRVRCQRFEVESGTTYKIKTNMPYISFREFTTNDESEDTILTDGWHDTSEPYTVTNQTKYVRFILKKGDSINITPSDVTEFRMIKYGSDNSSNDDLKMLGWTVPIECPIQNYTDSNGVFHQRVGRVDLGSLAWGYLTSPAPYFGTDLSGIKINTNNMYCKSYPITKSNVGIANMPDKTLKADGGSYAKVYVKDSSYTDATTFKSAMSGVYLYYELATEVTKSVDGNEIGAFVDITDNVTFNTTTFTAGNTKVYKVGNRVEVVFSNATIKTTSDNQVLISNVPIPAYYSFSANVTDYGSGGTQTGKAILLYAHRNGTIMSSNVVNQAKLYGTLSYTIG